MPSTYLDMAAMSGALKEFYSDQYLMNLTYSDNPFLALVPKEEDFAGEDYPQPIIWNNGQGRSSDFATAQSNQTALGVRKFLVTTKTDYQVATLENKAMLASRSSVGAFLKASTAIIDTSFQNLANSLASALFRSGTGVIGQASAYPGSGVITLSDANSAVQFEVGMTLRCAQTDGGAFDAASGYVVSVDYDAGTVTVAASQGGAAAYPSANWNGGSYTYLSVDGDRNAKVSGLAAWIPSSAPSSGESFYGVDRSVNPSRLAGIRFTGTSYPIDQALVEASHRVARQGGKPDFAIMGYDAFTALVTTLGSKRQIPYIDISGPVGIGFKGVEIIGANKNIRCIPDRNCPAGLAYLLQMDSWKLVSMKKAPHIIQTDGNEMLRVSNADANEVRMGYYGNLVCAAPGFNARVSLST